MKTIMHINNQLFFELIFDNSQEQNYFEQTINTPNYQLDHLSPTKLRHLVLIANMAKEWKFSNELNHCQLTTASTKDCS